MSDTAAKTPMMISGHRGAAYERRCDVIMMALDDLIVPHEPDSLTSPERRRLARFRYAGARHQFLWARHVARVLVANRLGLDLPAVQLRQRCPSCGSDEHGIPEPVDGIYVSWAHTMQAVAAAADTSPIGVDIESIVQFVDASEAMMKLLCTPAEVAMLPTDATDRAHALARLWTAKEALIKVGQTNLGSMRESHVGVVDVSERSTFQGWDLTTTESDGLMIAVASRSVDHRLVVDAAGQQ